MSNHPHFRRRYELMSFILNAAVPLSLVVVVAITYWKQQIQMQEIETLRAEIATIRLNLAVPTNVQPTYGSNNSTDTTHTSK